MDQNQQGTVSLVSSSNKPNTVLFPAASYVSKSIQLQDSPETLNILSFSDLQSSRKLPNELGVNPKTQLLNTLQLNTNLAIQEIESTYAQISEDLIKQKQNLLTQLISHQQTTESQIQNDQITFAVAYKVLSNQQLVSTFRLEIEEPKNLIFETLQYQLSQDAFRPGLIVRKIEQDAVFRPINLEISLPQNIFKKIFGDKTLNQLSVVKTCSFGNYQNVPIWCSGGVISVLKNEVNKREYQYLKESQKTLNLSSSIGIEDICQSLANSAILKEKDFLSFRKESDNITNSILELNSTYLGMLDELKSKQENIEFLAQDIMKLTPKANNEKKQILLNEKVSEYSMVYAEFEQFCSQFSQQEFVVFKKFRTVMQGLNIILPDIYVNLYHICNFAEIPELYSPVIKHDREVFKVKEEQIPSDSIGVAIGIHKFKAENPNEISIIKNQKYYVFSISEWANVCKLDEPDKRGIAPWKCLRAEQ
ncbi:hypothetical protein SS50377_26364 [Spironucleus salmonicida]|uniref:SH3 domain-containing protein n=1 Tax=Spironucleus salmonicida TaxID=348837 RepID=V6M3B5_9EUKA|nr:hypothetical protein SS50377_26364 [Spironucleus salmonicida]|eukprot:EST47769.1 Hypothetical protein SS50377_12168 [Spironucleus salmonicida]